jgi:hypothetical protein
MGNFVYSVLAVKKPLSMKSRLDREMLSSLDGYDDADDESDDATKGEVVIIPVDASKEAECAFDCEYVFFFSD